MSLRHHDDVSEGTELMVILLSAMYEVAGEFVKKMRKIQEEAKAALRKVQEEMKNSR